MRKSKDDKLIIASGFNPEDPTKFTGHKHYYIRTCRSGHENLTDQEIEIVGGVKPDHAGVPVCLRCIGDGKPELAFYNLTVHLKEVPAPIPPATDVAKAKGIMLTDAQERALNFVLHAGGPVQLHKRGVKQGRLFTMDGQAVTNDQILYKTWYSLIHKNLIKEISPGNWIAPVPDNAI